VPITIYTLSGTAGKDPTWGFCAEVAMRLVAADPATWEWFPVDYKPGFMPHRDIPYMSTNPGVGSATRAVAIVTEHVLSNPNYFVLCGCSQGAWISEMLYEELRNPAGTLYSKYPYLLNVVDFGSPRRPHGHTLTFADNLIGLVGQGACGNATYRTSFGTVPGVMDDPPSDGEIQWFCNQNDPASDCAAYLTTNVADGLAAILRWFMGGADIRSGVSLITRMLRIPVGLTLNNETASLISVIKQWWPFVGGAMGSPNAKDNNPHAQYDDPYPYTSIAGNTKSGVTLATEYLLGRGAQYATGPMTPIPKQA